MTDWYQTNKGVLAREKAYDYAFARGYSWQCNVELQNVRKMVDKLSSDGLDVIFDRAFRLDGRVAIDLVALLTKKREEESSLYC